MIHAYVGAAGTGKSYNLINEAHEISNSIQWQEHQSILAITFMHGSRKRMQQNLKKFAIEGRKISCMTIDSFCLEIVRRFRSFLMINGYVVPKLSTDVISYLNSENTLPLTFEEIRFKASYLLTMKVIQKCIRSTYPLIIVDEFQDCQNGLLEVIKGLSKCCELIVAADPFQYLDETTGNSEAIEWLNDNAQITELTEQHRTSNSFILNTAYSLRQNVQTQNGIQVIGNDKGGGLSAWHIASTIRWKNWYGKLAIISPVAPETSSFVTQTLSSLCKVLGQKNKIGPYPFIWENTPDILIKKAYAGLSAIINTNVVKINDLKILSNSRNTNFHYYLKSIYRYSLIRGLKEIPFEVLQNEVVRLMTMEITHFNHECVHNRTATTIHGAKNREFDYVFILWPYELRNSFDYHRKLLYNAVTRARFNALLIVQGGDKRIKKDPVLKIISNN